MDELSSIGTRMGKKNNVNLRLPSVAQERPCFSSLMIISHVIYELQNKMIIVTTRENVLRGPIDLFSKEK